MFVENMLIAETTLTRLSVVIVKCPVTAFWFGSWLARWTTFRGNVKVRFVVLIESRFVDAWVYFSDYDSQHMVLIVKLRHWREVRVERLCVDERRAWAWVLIHVRGAVRGHVWVYHRVRRLWRLRISSSCGRSRYRLSDCVDWRGFLILLLLFAFGKSGIIAFLSSM